MSGLDIVMVQSAGKAVRPTSLTHRPTAQELVLAGGLEEWVKQRL